MSPIDFHITGEYPVRRGYVSPERFAEILSKPVEKGGAGVWTQGDMIRAYIEQYKGVGPKPFAFEMFYGKPYIHVQKGLAWWEANKKRKNVVRSVVGGGLPTLGKGR
jgi:hypothetical protein